MVMRRTSRRLWLTFAAVNAVLSASASAHAQPTLPAAPAPAQASPEKDGPATADKARATELFNKSVDAYRQGDFKQAIALLDEAYALDPQPVLLYNRARAAEGMGDVDETIASYEKFLAQDPDAADRGAIEQRLVTLRRQRDERAALERERNERRDAPPPASSARPAAPETTAPAERRPPTVFPYVVAGAGAVGLAAGAIFGVMALSKNDDAAAEPIQKHAIDLKDGADRFATVSTMSFIVGGVLLIAGATWWVLEHRGFKTQGRTPPSWASLTKSGVGVGFP
jgi:tetratricopeptide (TPR) repeat protein